MAGFKASSMLLDAQRRPDAIFASLDRYALGTLAAAGARELSVPDDLMIAAGTDSELTRSANPPITGIDLHPERNGARAAEMLIERIEHPDTPDEQVIVPTDIVARASTRR